MGGLTWTPEHDEALRVGIEAGLSHQAIAESIGRTRQATSNRAQKLGLKNPEAARANNMAGIKAVHADPLRNEVRKQKISAAYTAERKARQAEVLRAVNAKRCYKSLSEETRRKLGDNLREFNAKRLAWLPSERRDEYKSLVSRVGAQEAKRIILADIAAKRARMSPFERQMEAVNRGAGLTRKQPIRTKDHDFTLGGVTSW